MRRNERWEREQHWHLQVLGEKRKRLETQVEYLQEGLQKIDRLVHLYAFGTTNGVTSGGDRRPRVKVSPESLLSTWLIGYLQEEREVLDRETKTIQKLLVRIDGSIRVNLGLEARDRQSANTDPSFASPSHHNGDSPGGSVLCEEDLFNLDEGILYLERSLDYLRSCRRELIAAKGELELERLRWKATPSVLLRHTSLGRAGEMAAGADLNLTLGLKEMACVPGWDEKPTAFREALFPLLKLLQVDPFDRVTLDKAVRLVGLLSMANRRGTDWAKERRTTIGQYLRQGVEPERVLSSRDPIRPCT